MKKTSLILWVILVVALVLRIYHLDSNPPAVYGDEQSFAWNAYNILKTGTDEYGVRLPLQFRAFDDYKSLIPVYLLVPLFAIFGMNTFILRLPVALFAVATVWMTYLLVKKLHSERVALLTSALLAISPWHIHLSRGYFESTIALFFFVTSIYLFCKAKEKITYLYLSAFFFALTLYTYFTPRIMLLMFIPFLLWWGKDWIFKQKRAVFIFTFILIVLTSPLIKASIFDKGLSRISKLMTSRNEQIEKQVVTDRNSVQSPHIVRTLLHNRYVYWVRIVVNDYFEQLSVNFWYLYGDSSLRYFLGNMGMFYMVEMPFLIVGFLALFRKHNQLFWLVVCWILIAPFAGAISGRPFGLRTLALLPAPYILVAVGLVYAWRKVARARYKLVLYTLCVTAFVFSLTYYLVRYHLEYPSYAATWWGWENKAAIDLALKNQDSYDKIFISNFYSGLDLAFAYYTQQDPQIYRDAKQNKTIFENDKEFIQLGKFYIGSLDIDTKRMAAGALPTKSLYIARPEEVQSNETIRDPSDGRVLFYVYRTN